MFFSYIWRPYGQGQTLGDQCYKHLVPTGRKQIVPTGRSQTVPTGRSQTVPTGRTQIVPTGRSQIVPTGRSQTVPTGPSQTVPTGRRQIVPTGRSQTVPTGLTQIVPARRWIVSAGRQIVPARGRLNAFVAITIALSFIATLIPVASASLIKSSTMACCAGKVGGHCDSGIAAKKVPPPKSEPMCGLHGAEMEEDGITIVAQPVAESPHSHSRTAETNSSQPAAESASLSQPCHMDCASCATGAPRQQKHRRNTVQPTT